MISSCAFAAKLTVEKFTLPLPGQNIAIAERNGYVPEIVTSVPTELSDAGGHVVPELRQEFSGLQLVDVLAVANTTLNWSGGSPTAPL